MEDTAGADGTNPGFPRRPSFVYQVLVGVSVMVGLFFVEYPPIFLLGYWSWGALAHKSLTGILLVLNLLIAQRAAKRLGLTASGTGGKTRPKP